MNIYTVSNNDKKVCNVKATTISGAFDIIESLSYDAFKEALHMRFDLDELEYLYNRRNEFSYALLHIFE